MNDEELQMLDDLLDKDEGLGSKEIDFIENLSKNYQNRSLSERQHDWLVNIWDRVVG